MMWSSFLEKGKEFAEKAKQAAESLDKQLNETVGIAAADESTTILSSSASTTNVPNAGAFEPGAGDDAVGPDDDALNDAWDDDEFNVDGFDNAAAASAGVATPTTPAPEAKMEAVTPDTTIAPVDEVSSIPSSPIPSPLSPQPVTEQIEPHPKTEAQKLEQDQAENTGEEWDDDNLAMDDVDLAATEPATAIVDNAVSSLRSEAQLPLEETEQEASSASAEVASKEIISSAPEQRPVEPEHATPQEEEGTPQQPSQISIASTPHEESELATIPTEGTLKFETSEEQNLDMEPPSDETAANEPPTVIAMDHDDDNNNHNPAANDDYNDGTTATENSKEQLQSLGSSAAFTVSEDVLQKMATQDEVARLLTQKIEHLQSLLQQREDQLVSKTEQLTTIQAMHDSEKEELRIIIQNTKEEAKKRIQKAKERVEQTEAKLKTLAAAQNSSAGDAAQQAEIVAALREEGEKLARKQAEMEKAVRSAKGEARQLRESLEEETFAKEAALSQVAKLEADLKSTQENLAAARKGETLAGKLETELQQAKEEMERKSSTILSLEQQVKELKTKIKDLSDELEAAKKGAFIETQREQQKLRKEHNETISDLEKKLRVTERDAALREDTLRHEVDELRKRWQDAVRRADALAMDIQSSTAPLLRQLESAERQSRARAAAAAEIETKLRAELEEYVVSNEKISKERTELKTKFSRLERSAKESEEQLKAAKSSLEEKTAKVNYLEDKLRDLEAERAKKKEEYAEVERLANEGVARVRSEMTQTVVESEERYRSQIESLQGELRKEQDKRRQLERQVQQLMDNAGTMIVPPSQQGGGPSVMTMQAKPKKLRNSTGQAEILTGALSGLGAHYDSDEDDDDDDNVGEEADGADGAAQPQRTSEPNRSFAALEEINSRLKAAKVELNALRKSLADSEKAREQLAAELGESRDAKERLPQLERQVAELTEENRRMELEIQSMQDEFEELKEFYKTQLSLLLDEKSFSHTVNGDASNAHKDDHANSNSNNDTSHADANDDPALQSPEEGVEEKDD